MRVSFKYSQEDLVDASTRFAARSKAIRDIRRRSQLWSIGLLLLVALLMLKVWMMLAIVAAAWALIIVFTYSYMFGRRYRQNVRKLYKEQFGDENEFICEVELTPEGMKTSARNCEVMTEWNTVEEIVPTDGSVDVFSRKGGCIVRDRAFASPEERQRFIDLAREYMNKSHAPAQT